MDYIKAIEAEIKWSESNPGKSANGTAFELGFIKGLKQAIYLIKEVDKK